MFHFVALLTLGIFIFANVAMSKMKCHWVVFVIVNAVLFVLANLAGDGLKHNGF